jgi:hypothetical protein
MMTVGPKDARPARRHPAVGDKTDAVSAMALPGLGVAASATVTARMPPVSAARAVPVLVHREDPVRGGAPARIG